MKAKVAAYLDGSAAPPPICSALGIAMALASTLEEGESFTTLELKMNFLRPVWHARLAARARVVSKGRTVALVACDVFDEKERHIASATSTEMLLTGDAAKGR